MSIRTKILTAFISLILLSLGIFFFIASDSFRKDKITYIYDSNQVLTEGKSYAVLTILSSWKNGLQAIYPYVAPDGRSISAPGLNVWQSFNDLRKISVTDQANSALFTNSKPAVAPDQKQSIHFRFSKDRGFEVPLLAGSPLPKDPWWLEGQLQISALERILRAKGETILILVDSAGNSVLPAAADFNQDLASLAVSIGLAQRGSETVRVSFRGEDWFLGISKIPDQTLRILAFTPESVLNKLLQNLFIKSLIVCLMILFLVVGITVFLSRGITRNLDLLSGAVRNIGKGHFDFKLKMKTKDETAQLANAFSEMSTEIQSLLVKTADQSRMEEELKTGKLVQSTLFPFEGMIAHQVEIKGFYQSATECGGDWWYYKYQAGHLFAVVADATGHGVPAALITSAARAAFSLVSWNTGPSAANVAQDLNRAIYNVSKGQVLMTALIVKLNVETGHLEIANCSHEAMIQYDGHGEVNMVLPIVSSRLGEKEEIEIEAEHLFLESKHSLFIYTDGIKDLKTVGKRPLGDKQLLRVFKNAPVQAEAAVAYVLEEIALTNQEGPLKDDVTFVVIHRN